MSTLTLDRSDAGVDEMVSAWKNGGQYQVLLRVQQIGSDPTMSTFHVTEVQNQTDGEEGAAEAEEPEETEPAPANPKAKPELTVAY